MNLGRSMHYFKGAKEHRPSLGEWLMYVCGAQWLSGRVLDSRPKGRGFEPHRRHCAVSLS